MTFWIEHGRRNRKEDKPSEEEKALNRREEGHNKKAVSNSKGQKGRKKAAVAAESQSTTRNGPRKRVSQRIKEDGLSKKDHCRYKVDIHGCSHDDPSTWQHQFTMYYHSKRKRAERKSNNKDVKLLSLNCCDCDEVILDE